MCWQKHAHPFPSPTQLDRFFFCFKSTKSPRSTPQLFHSTKVEASTKTAHSNSQITLFYMRITLRSLLKFCFSDQENEVFLYKRTQLLLLGIAKYYSLPCNSVVRGTVFYRFNWYFPSRWTENKNYFVLSGFV